MVKKILLFTSYYPTKEAIRLSEEAKKLGYKFEVFNINNLSYSIKSKKLSTVPALPKDFDFVLVRAVFKNIKESVTLLENIKERGIPLFDNGFIKNRYVINKVNDILKLSVKGFNVPDTIHTSTQDFGEFKKLALSSFKYPFIVKRVNLGKGVGVYLVKKEEELDEIIKETKLKQKQSKTLIAQQFVDYVHDLRILVLGNKTFAMKRIPSKGEFRANFSLGGSVELFSIDSTLKNLALKAAKSLGLTIAGVDVLIDSKGKPYVLEVNHNPGFVGMEQATQKNIAKLYLKTAFENYC